MIVELLNRIIDKYRYALTYTNILNPKEDLSKLYEHKHFINYTFESIFIYIKQKKVIKKADVCIDYSHLTFEEYNEFENSLLKLRRFVDITTLIDEIEKLPQDNTYVINKMEIVNRYIKDRQDYDKVYNDIYNVLRNPRKYIDIYNIAYDILM